MQLDLFSSPGEDDISYIVEACRPHLVNRTNPIVAYLPTANLSSDFLSYTQAVFRDLGQVNLLKLKELSPAELEITLDQAAVIYVSGGNTYYLADQFHQHKALEILNQKIFSGLPYVGFSAGAVICGPNVLTCNDLNCCATTNFTGLNLTPYNFFPHYPQAEGQSKDIDSMIWEYHQFYSNTVLAISDRAHIRISDGRTELIEGDCWLLPKEGPKLKLSNGYIETVEDIQ